jgi:alkyl hydroperoxide reductase subunit AhpC
VDQLGKLKTLLSQTEKQGVQILTISLDTHLDSENMLVETAKMPGDLDFPLLEDKGHEVIDRYGIRNPAEVKPGIPYPTVYIIDRQGIVRHRFVDPENYSRPSNEEIREELKRIGAVR